MAEISRYWRLKNYLLNPNGNGYRPECLPGPAEIGKYQQKEASSESNFSRRSDQKEAIIYQAPVEVSV